MLAPLSPAAPPLRQRHYQADGMNTAIPGWDLHAVQTSAGRLAGHAEDFQIDGLQILRERHQQVQLNEFGTAPRDAIIIGAPMGMAGEGRLNGRAWSGLSAWDGRREFDSIVPPGELFSIVIQRDRLFDYVAATEQIDLTQWVSRGCVLLNDPHVTAQAAQWMDRWLSDMAHLTSHTSQQPLAQHTVMNDLLEWLGPLVVDHLYAHTTPITDTNAMVVVQRARDYACAHIHEPLQVIDLCHAARVSRRTLQDSFQSVLGLRPLHYLHALRLDGAHRQLRAGEPGLMVKEVAERWGFWHLSRFGQAYRETFGELPSETLQRAQEARGAGPATRSRQPPQSCS